MDLLINRLALVVLNLTAQLVFVALGGAVGVAAESAQESVTGHVDFVNANTGNHIRYSVNAIRHRDGSVSGEAQEHAYSATGEFLRAAHATVTCFTITGNIARIGLVVDHSSGASVPPGTEAFLTVVDNGQGANDPADLASPAGSGAPGVAEAHCTTGFNRLLFPVDAGNIQVRPSGL